MKLVSFDIGLRNLSFCVLEGTNRSNLKILHWELIDVMAEAAGLDKPTCYKCKKPATWMKKDESSFSCKTHCPSASKPPTKKSLNEKSLDMLKTAGTREGVNGTTKKELVDKLYDHYRSNCWLKAIKSAKQVSVVNLASDIAKCMDSRKELWRGADKIVFEQQPERRMFGVESMLHMWFTLQGFKTSSVSAIHKLTNIVTLRDAIKTYKGRKSTGIVHATELVKDTKWREYMLKHPKKDDLADCFLQGLWVLEH